MDLPREQIFGAPIEKKNKLKKNRVLKRRRKRSRGRGKG